MPRHSCAYPCAQTRFRSQRAADRPGSVCLRRATSDCGPHTGQRFRPTLRARFGTTQSRVASQGASRALTVPSVCVPRQASRAAEPPEVFEGLEADVRAARALLDDLAALVEAGLVARVP